MTLDYFYGQAGGFFSFFRIPKALFQEQRFQDLSTDAKILYGILLDRMNLSVKNEWFDKKGRVFIIFTMRPFCPQFEIFRLEKNAMLTLEWIGKNKVVNHHQEVPFRVLERQYSFDEQGQHTENNDSENTIIHGDNLEALKALLPQYEGKVKCIYIVILTPILMSILSSENAVRLNFIIHIMFLALFEMRNYNVLCGGAKWTI